MVSSLKKDVMDVIGQLVVEDERAHNLHAVTGVVGLTLFGDKGITGAGSEHRENIGHDLLYDHTGHILESFSPNRITLDVDHLLMLLLFVMLHEHVHGR